LEVHLSLQAQELLEALSRAAPETPLEKTQTLIDSLTSTEQSRTDLNDVVHVPPSTQDNVPLLFKNSTESGDLAVTTSSSSAAIQRDTPSANESNLPATKKLVGPLRTTAKNDLDISTGGPSAKTQQDLPSSLSTQFHDLPLKQDEPTPQPLDKSPAATKPSKSIALKSSTNTPFSNDNDDNDYLKPYPDVKTVALRMKKFPSGFRNQMMAFNALVMWADELGYGQILLQRVGHKDTLGTEKLIRHQDLFDVRHWNSYYPALPRMVACDPKNHVDFDCNTNDWKPGVDLESDEIKPKRLKYMSHQLMYAYMHYTRGKGVLAELGAFPNKVDLLIMQGALRPCPELTELVNRKLSHLGGGDEENVEYMTLHLRVEPDMQRHPVWYVRGRYSYLLYAEQQSSALCYTIRLGRLSCLAFSNTVFYLYCTRLLIPHCSALL
jgi:hypothetical protein